MWLSLYFPSLNETMLEHRAIYSASPYGMPMIVHHDDASTKLAPQTGSEYFDA